jgi:two-component system sensor histidine kinase ChvG
MALDTERAPPIVAATPPQGGTGSGGVRSRLGVQARALGGAIVDRLQPLRAAAAPLIARLAPLARRIAPWLPAAIIARSLRRQIVFWNLVGLLFLLLGLIYVSQHNAWLIDAKRESLRAQGEIIAAAIAANATIDGDRGVAFDPDKLPEIEGGLVPFRDDGFAALELSIAPERVTPILRRLVQPTNNRARIYGRDGTLIVDSAMLLTRGQIARPATEETSRRVRTKSFWTRLTQRLYNLDLPVYREIGSANGKAYSEVRMALQGSTTPMLLLTEDREQIVSVAVPIQRARQIQGVLLLSNQPGEIEENLNEERRAVLTIALIALAATLLVSTWLARTVAGPMRRLSDAAEAVSRNIKGRHDLPDLSDRTDEVGQMAKAFRTMTTALYQRAEASEKFAADVAHELKNPLTAARSVAESLGYAKTEAQRQQLIGQIQWELKRLNRLITDVSNASRLDAELALQKSEPVDMVRVAQGIVTTFRDVLSESRRRVAIDIGPAASGAYVVSGHEGRLGQVLTNLIDNAVSFSPDDGVVTVRLRRRGEEVLIAVEDQGPGLPEDKLERIFERFYTDRPETEAKRGKNSGLGLSISREIVRAHGGSIHAENIRPAGAAEGTPPEGARFVVSLPLPRPMRERGSHLLHRRG